MRFRFVLVIAGCFVIHPPQVGARTVPLQAQSPKAEDHSSPGKEISGTILLVDDLCGFFVLLSKATEGEAQTKFLRDPNFGNWARKRGGCAVVFVTGREILLNSGLWVTVRYSDHEGKNLVSGLLVASEEQPGPRASGANTPGRSTVTPPKCLSCPPPQYTQEARKAHLEGSVRLEIVVGPDGKPSNVRVTRGLGLGLDEMAIKAVRNWEFKPALSPEGKPVPVELTIEVGFRIDVR